MVQFFVCGIHASYCLLVAKNYPPWLCCLNLFVQGNMTILFRDFYKQSYNPKTKAVATLPSPSGSSSVTGEAAEKSTVAEQNIQTYKMAEVSTRNGGNGVAWCVVNNDVLDLTTFVSSHPGGNVIVLASGIDATILYHTYHPNGIPTSVYNALKIGEVEKDNKKKSSYYDWSSDFYVTLRKRVTQRLREIKRPRRGNLYLWIKACFLLVLFWSSLYMMCVSSKFWQGKGFFFFFFALWSSSS